MANDNASNTKANQSKVEGIATSSNLVSDDEVKNTSQHLPYNFMDCYDYEFSDDDIIFNIRSFPTVRTVELRRENVLRLTEVAYREQV